MSKVVRVKFAVKPLEDTSGPVSIVPLLDGTSLVVLTEEFEQKRGFTPAGGYAGLVPSHFNLGSIECYYLGKAEDKHLKESGFYLLGCTCGEVGCWPLTASIVRTADLYMWQAFRQPHRPDRDYSEFGPFAFDSKQYESAVSDLVIALNKCNAH